MTRLIVAWTLQKCPIFSFILAQKVYYFGQFGPGNHHTFIYVSIENSFSPIGLAVIGGKLRVLHISFTSMSPHLIADCTQLSSITFGSLFLAHTSIQPIAGEEWPTKILFYRGCWLAAESVSSRQSWKWLQWTDFLSWSKRKYRKAFYHPHYILLRYGNQSSL